MDSLRVTDDASKAVQKTPNRISLDSILADIDNVEYIHPESLPSMTICVMRLKNGFVLIGKSAPADPENFSKELGERYSHEDCVRQAWPLYAFALRNQMSAS